MTLPSEVSTSWSVSSAPGAEVDDVASDFDVDVVSAPLSLLLPPLLPQAVRDTTPIRLTATNQTLRFMGTSEGGRAIVGSSGRRRPVASARGDRLGVATRAQHRARGGAGRGIVG